MDKIVVNNISKAYKIYSSPKDKLKEAFSVKKKTYHSNFWALKDISFKVPSGQILGIMGHNGAGKSTLLKIITGVLKPTAGDVLVDGRISSLLELGAGFNPEYSGIENIYFYGPLVKLSQMQVNERMTDILSFAEIGDYVYQPVKTYSSGMFARLAFACAINVSPDILIVDEILSVGDMRFQAKCFNRFKEFKKKGVTILYVGHDIGLMKTFCDRAIWLNEGNLVLDGEPVYVASKYTEFMYVNMDSALPEIVETENSTADDSSSPRKEELLSVEKAFNKDKVLNHWGTHEGMVQHVLLTNLLGQEQNVFSPSEDLSIKIFFKIFKNINYSNFSISFSIKNTEGTDLIVKSTYDEGIAIPSTNEFYELTFSLKTRLAQGDYYLVVALEDRSQTMIQYYEYLEGIKYFKVYSEKPVYGIVDLDTQILIK